ncbi:DUF3846 domain-containing protein [Bengtsoniella intestinalis]|uniref:DUF3846 domain-containing protein n=1 Tax=Bengtsoniella intestinalis TaxID=3073143 RepID=UPI00391F5393
MRVLLVEPKQVPKVVDIGEDLKAMQEVVGGIIQVVYPFKNPDVAVVCHDEGKVIGMPLNRGLRGEDGKVYDIISGTFFVCGAPVDGEDFVSLTEEQVATYSQWFATPEQFVFIDGQALALPLVEVTV